ncbi:MAG: winged helix-turn-helix domain-containing tetratricopeptide repeat protein [Boseongicola sp.]
MTYIFENFELDEARAELRREGDQVPVEPQVFELIKLLVSAQDRVVTRDEIFEVIWGNRIVSDAALSSRIRDARKALGDDGSAQRLIRTVQRRGLRFVGEVRESAAAAKTVETDSGSSAATSLSDDVLDRPAIAVLPFESLSEDAADKFLADGLTDEIVAALSAWRYFPVISRTTTLRYRAPTPPGQDIGTSTGARYVLSGTFRKQEQRIKVSVALTDTELDQQIWSKRITRDLDELVDLEEEIAAQVATLLAPELEGAEARRVLRRPSSDLTAWELAMRAAWLIEQGSEADFAQAEHLASQAIERAPDWTLPYTLIAIAKFQQAMLGFSGSDTGTAFSETLRAAKQALEIDRGAWIAHALTAVGELWTNNNHERALLHVNRAIELNPSAAMNYHFGGCITGFSGDPEGARKYQERLFRLDPLYPYTAVIEADLGLWHLLDEELLEANDRLQRSHQWDPRYGRALQRQISLAGLNGDRDAAMIAARKLSDLGLPLNYDSIAASYPFRNPDHNEIFLDGLRRSGVNF